VAASDRYGERDTSAKLWVLLKVRPIGFLAGFSGDVARDRGVDATWWCLVAEACVWV
jgi:hypothetical protein